MKIFYTLVCVLGVTLLATQPLLAQDTWPKSITQSNGTVIKVYQWQPESFTDNTLKAQAAISVLESGKTDPVFGMAWVKATTQTNGSNVRVLSARIQEIKLPGEADDDKLDGLKQTIENQVGNWNLSLPLSDLQSSLDLNKQQTDLSKEIKNAPPKVLYTTSPSILVSIDGAPRLERNKEWGVEAVVNTPFTIVKNNGSYFLFGGKHWYQGPSALGPYSMTSSVPNNLNKIEQSLKNANKEEEQGKETDEHTIYKIVVTTEPAELIQSKGEANFAGVDGTGLLYVSNSADDIFMDTNSQQYYVLISGRWYKSKTLSGTWQYVSASELPADFARINEGSPKDNVLASVAGTDAAKEAVREAAVPQTAKVDRSKAQSNITYDGDPEFEDIDGTDLAYATNTPGSVIRWRGRYYSVEDGVWFESRYATGPWAVAVDRPTTVALIPPRYPVYHVKYVYIYDVTPDYVWMGYTPGYLNTFIYGPTVVYGTGYHYSPWHRRYYYPRPSTWGYGVRYNPWFGWGFGFNYNAGWFHVNIGIGNYDPWGYWGGGWWGPRYYRMPYCYTPYHSGRYYGYYNNGYYNHRSAYIGYANRYNNVYNNRRDVYTRDNQRYMSNGDRYGNRRFADGNRNGNRFEPSGRPGGSVSNGNRFDGNNNNSNGRFNGNRNNSRFDGSRGIGSNPRTYDRGNRSDQPGSRPRVIAERPDRTGNTTPGSRGPVRNDVETPGRPSSVGSGTITPGNREWRGDRGSGTVIRENPGRVSQPQREPSGNRGGGFERPNRSGGGGFDRPAPQRSGGSVERSSPQRSSGGGSGGGGSRQGGGGREGGSGGGSGNRPSRS